MLKTNSKTHFIVCIAILGALSGVLMLLEFPLPIAPPFYKVDLSDVLAGLIVGSIAAILAYKLINYIYTKRRLA